MLSKNPTLRTASQGARGAIEPVKRRNHVHVASVKASGYRKARNTAYWHELIVLVPVHFCWKVHPSVLYRRGIRTSLMETGYKVLYCFIGTVASLGRMGPVVPRVA